MEKLLDAGEVSEILRFWRQYGFDDCSYDELKEIIEAHLSYNTLEIVRDNGNIVALCRYNINGDTCHCIDAIVHPDYRRQNLLKVMLIKGLLKFPNTKYLYYQRGFKPRKEYRTFNIYEFLNIKESK